MIFRICALHGNWIRVTNRLRLPSVEVGISVERLTRQPHCVGFGDAAPAQLCASASIRTSWISGLTSFTF